MLARYESCLSFLWPKVEQTLDPSEWLRKTDYQRLEELPPFSCPLHLNDPLDPLDPFDPVLPGLDNSRTLQDSRLEGMFSHADTVCGGAAQWFSALEHS